MTGGHGDSGMGPEPTRLAGRFLLRRRVAEGGMGTVYEALDEDLDRTVAIKVLRTGGDGAAVERFRTEARAVASLNHPGIVALYDHGVDDGRHYLVMELVDGRDLASLLHEHGPLAPAPALDTAAQIAQALQHAHTAGVVHRDVKPANILLEHDGRARLTDFGIARMVDAAAMTATGTMIGTARYCAPEQVAGEPVGPAADIYATGLVLYELLTNRRPFDGDNPSAVAARRLTDPVPPPSLARPDLPAVVDEVVLRATARHPADRYPNAAAFADALRAAANGVPSTPITAQLPTVPTRPARPAHGGARYTLHRWWQERTRPQRQLVAGMVGLLGLILIALAVTGGAQNSPAQDTPTAEGAPDERGSADAQDPPQTQDPPSEPAPGPQTPPEDTVFEITSQIIGLDGQQVAERLEEAGFVVELRPTDADRPAGTIIDVEPEVGGHVQTGDTIILHIAGPESG